MAETFPLEVVTPTGIVFQGDVAQVSAWNPLGEFGVLPEHINYITSLVPGVMEIRLPGGDLRYLVVSGGLAEVKDGKMTVLADSTEAPEEIDIQEVEVQIRDAQGRIQEVSMFAEEYQPLHHDLMIAQARKSALEHRANH